MNHYLQKILPAFPKSKKILIAFGSLIIIIFTIAFIDFFHSSQNVSSIFEKDYYNVYNVRIPKTIYFANEKVPVEQQQVREYLAKELIKNTSWKKQSLLLHRRSAKWFPIIIPLLKKHNVPEDFKYVALIESQLTNAVSPKGATGFWQILESTGKDYHLEINEDVDERFNVVKSTEAACKYFKDAYKQLNDWTLVAASYNKGVSGIQNQLLKQNTKSYYQLKLNRETGHYLYKILAMKELIENPKVYGLKVKIRIYKPIYTTKKITVDSSITNLETFAISKGIDIFTFKLLNPWLISNKLKNDSSFNYIIELPLNTSDFKKSKKEKELQREFIDESIMKTDSVFSKNEFD